MNSSNTHFSKSIVVFSKNQLLETLIVQERTATTIQQFEFLTLWFNFISRIEKKLAFVPRTDEPESFSIPLAMEEFQANLTFNIDRINDYVSKDIIKTSTITDPDFLNRVDISEEFKPLDEYKEENPIIIYLPTRSDTEYLCIDGNHRIHNYRGKGLAFECTLIDPENMKPEFFYDLYSFIAYEIVALYARMTNCRHEEKHLIEESKKIINDVLSRFFLNSV